MMRAIFNPYFLLVLLALLPAARAQTVNVSSDAHKQIHMGEPGVYQFTLQSQEIDPEIAPPEIPKVEGLSFEFAGVSPRISRYNINGRRFQEISKTYQYRVTGSEIGSYVVPSFKINVDGTDLTVPPVRIQITEPRKAPEMKTELILPRESVYVGEAVPATLRLTYNPEQIKGIRRANSNSIFSVKEGDAFTIGDFGNEKSRMVQENGTQLREYTWQVMITPLKSGPQPMVIMTNLIAFTDTGRMFRQYDAQNVSLYTDDKEIDILPLPTADQPEDFTGGIGLYSVDEPIYSQSATKAGEPLTMRLVVRGQGNFNRLQAPTLEASDNWRDYPPEEQFSAADNLGYTGYKVFDYTLIPRNSGELTTPEINFNFFDPESAKYVELPIPGKTISVQANPNAQRPAPNPVTSRRGPELLPIAEKPGQWVAAIKPVITNPLFIGAQGIPAILLGFIIFHRRRELRLQNDAAYARAVHTDRQTKLELASASQAAQSQDTVAFYAAAQRAVQAAAGRTVAQAPESLTIEDIEAIAVRLGLDEGQIQTAREFIEASDAIRFGGIHAANSNLAQELARLESTVIAFGRKS